MPHMVIFRSTEGKPGYHQAETVDEAARFVEHLRNQEGVSEARIYRMQEVPIEFRAYYRVEVGSVPSNSGWSSDSVNSPEASSMQRINSLLSGCSRKMNG